MNTILIGLVYGVIHMLAFALAMHFVHGGELRNLFARTKGREWGIGASTGLVIFAVRAMLPYVSQATWALFIGGIVATIAVVYICHEWAMEHDDAGMAIPMVLTIISVLPICQTIWVAFNMGAVAIENPFWASVVSALPVLIAISAIAFIMADYFFYQYSQFFDMDSEFALDRRMFGWVVVAVATILAILLITGVVPGVAQIDWGAIGNNGNELGIELGSEADFELPDPSELDLSESLDKANSVTGNWVFYNSELQEDEDESNDFNFGPDPYWEDGDASDWYDPDFRDRITKDPALGAADIAWFDAVMGTRVLGEFHASIQGDWAKAINEAKERFIADPELYKETVKDFFRWLDAAEVEVRYDEDLTDQMYMDPYVNPGIPDVILMETSEHEGLFLVYSFAVKDNTAEVKYRIECGYQPTNVATVMHWKPAENPTKSSELKASPTKKPKSEKTKKPKEDKKPKSTKKPKEDKKPKDSKKKDPSKGTQGDPVGKNDNPGPGESTNSGKGSKKSSKQAEKSSTDLKSHEEYKEKVEEKKHVNETQKKGGDSNAPSSNPNPAPAAVDNNGSKGNGGGSADAPTPVQAPAHEASTGASIADQPAGEAWEGPPD